MTAVGDLLREAAHVHVLPHAASAAELKAPGEWVTAADRATEAFLTPCLAELVPGSVVVGEEAAHANPAIMARLDEPGPTWLLDPIDGTANYAAGSGPYAVMAALLVDRAAVASWLLDPATGRMCVAERGAGAWVDGVRVTTTPSTSKELHGPVLRRFLPAPLDARIDASALVPTAGSGCAGHDHPAVATGEHDFALFWRTLPWDHAPGVLFVLEAGGVAGRLDGSAYLAADHARPGLLVARDDTTWWTVRNTVAAED